MSKNFTNSSTPQRSYEQKVECLLKNSFKGKLLGWDEIREQSVQFFGENPNPLVWGSIAKKLVRDGIIVKTSLRQPSTLPQCHGRDVPIYKVL